MDSAFILSIVRHALQFGAGLLVSKGLIDVSMSEQLIGGVLSVATVGWYMVDKSRGAQK